MSVQGWALRPEPPYDLAVSCSLDLDAWINEPLSDSESEDEKPKAIFHDEEQRQAKPRQPEADEEELARVSTPCPRQGCLSPGLPGRRPCSEQPLTPCPRGAMHASVGSGLCVLLFSGEH